MFLCGQALVLTFLQNIDETQIILRAVGQMQVEAGRQLPLGRRFVFIKAVGIVLVLGRPTEFVEIANIDNILVNLMVKVITQVKVDQLFRMDTANVHS